MGTGDPSGVAQVLAGLAALNAADVAGLSDEQVRTELLALLPAVNQLQAAVLDRVASFDARDLAHGDGQNVASTWLVNYGRMSKGSALRLVAHGRLLRQLPALAGGMRSGSVSDE